MITFKEQNKPPNFIGKNGDFFLVRCFNCGGDYGRENYLPAVASGECEWCNWSKEKAEVENDKE